MSGELPFGALKKCTYVPVRVFALPDSLSQKRLLHCTVFPKVLSLLEAAGPFPSTSTAAERKTFFKLISFVFSTPFPRHYLPFTVSRSLLPRRASISSQEGKLQNSSSSAESSCLQRKRLRLLTPLTRATIQLTFFSPSSAIRQLSLAQTGVVWQLNMESTILATRKPDFLFLTLFHLPTMV